MNVSTLQAPPPTQINWSTSKAEEKDVDFLTLRLLNKRMRIRISPQSPDLSVIDGKGNYLALSYKKGWFVAIARGASGENRLVFSTLTDLRNSIQSSTSEGEEELQPKRRLNIAGAPPTHLALGANDERLMVGHTDGSIAIYDTSKLFVAGEDLVEPLHTLPPAPPGPLRQIVGNPGDLPDLVVVRRDAEGGGDGLAVEVLDVRNCQSVGGWKNAGTPETTPTSVTWSPKGKQIAIGFRSGDIVTYSPSDTKNPKQHIPKPPQAGEASLINIVWLSNHAFYGIYTAPGDRRPEATQKHFLTTRDIKTNGAVQTQFETPYYPTPAMRPPGAFPVVIRNWDPVKFFMFISDSTSGDIGTVGSLSKAGSSDEHWFNISLEETSTPSLPLDKDDNDTFPLALELDATFSGGDDSKPILYLYASDGTLQAWSISNSKGGSYPGMVSASTLASVNSGSSIPEESMATDKPAPPTFGQPSSTTSGFGSTTTPTSVFGQTSNAAFGASGFGNLQHNNSPQPDPVKPAFGQTSSPAFGASSMGQPTVFGQAVNSTPTFGQSSAFGSQTSAFGSNPSGSSGFATFASQGTSKFGSTGFGFGGAPSSSPLNNVTSAPSPPVDAASPEAEMSEADDDKASGGFGGLSLGSASTSKPQDNGAVNSMFGSFSETATTNQAPPTFGSGTGAFGNSSQQSFGTFGSSQGSSFIKPASGFGAFSSASKPAENPVQIPAASNVDSKPSPAFGASGFATGRPQPAFGQSTFGQSTFGQSSFSTFGKSAFGAPSTPSSSSAPSTGGAFSSFAGSPVGFSSFAKGGTSVFGQTSESKAKETESAEKDPVPSSTTSSSGAFGAAKSPSAFGGLGQQDSKPSPFGTSSQSTNAFGGGAFLTPAKGTTGNTFSTPNAPSLATAPTTRMKTPESSPEGSPVTSQRLTLTQDSPSGETKSNISSDAAKQSATPTTTPSPSPFKASSPAATSGAFGNLSSSPSVFRPAEGFGAFGASAKVPSSSPFANPKPVTTSAFGSPVSAFGAGGSGSSFATATPGKPGTTTPTFGSPSAFGSAPAFGKSAFGTPVSTTPTTTPSKPATGAFSAYSSGGGFTAFAGAGKSSFSELLKTKDEVESKEKKSPSDPSAKDSDFTKDNKASTSSQSAKPESTFITIPKPDEIDHDNLPPTPSSHGTFDDEEEEDNDDAGSFLSENFSDGIPEEGEEAEEDDRSEEEDDHRDAETSGLSPKISRLGGTLESKDTTPKATPAKDTGVGVTTTPSIFGTAGKTPLFGKAPESLSPSLVGSKTSGDGNASKSPSPSPFSKPFSFGQSPSPPIAGKAGSPLAGPSTTPSPFSKPSIPSITQSTTPPGSPQKEEPSPVFAPKPIAPALSSASSLGLGRPSSRPTKSSPLAGAPVTNDASPKKPVGQIDNSTIKLEPATPSPPKTADSRPSKTPPAFSFGGTPSTPSTLPAFSLSPATNPPPFKMPSATATPLPARPATGPNAVFNMQPQSNTSAPLPISRPLFGPMAQGAPLPPSSASAAPKALQQPQQQEMQTKFESEMQAGCFQLCLMLQKELGELQKVSQDAAAIRARVGRSTGVTHTKADFGDKTKWAMGDIDAFTRLLKSIEKDLLVWYDFKAEITPTLRSVESNLLKAETRKEEIVRFSKAKADPEFSKMLKTRTLGPDATETQSQLRKQIRLINDRVEQLESHLKACKKKVEEHRKGRTSMKPPSLDTINRTYRNIDLALEAQLNQISELSERVSRLNLRAMDSPVSRGSSLPPTGTTNGTNGVHGNGKGLSASANSGKGRFRPEVTPSVAASTAAALNAERSAMRLKLALAKVRSTPLMNTQAVDEPKRRIPTLTSEHKVAPSASSLPGGPLSIATPWSTPLGPGIGAGVPLTPARSVSPTAEQSPETSPTSQRQVYNRGSRHTVHAKAPPLGKTHARVPSEIRSFDWGPLPGAKPMTSLPADVRPDMSRATP